MMKVTDFGKRWTNSFEDDMVFVKGCLKCIEHLVAADSDPERVQAVVVRDYDSLKRWLRRAKFPGKLDVFLHPKEYRKWKQETKPGLVKVLR